MLAISLFGRQEGRYSRIQQVTAGPGFSLGSGGEGRGDGRRIIINPSNNRRSCACGERGGTTLGNATCVLASVAVVIPTVYTEHTVHEIALGSICVGVGPWQRVERCGAEDLLMLLYMCSVRVLAWGDCAGEMSANA